MPFPQPAFWAILVNMEHTQAFTPSRTRMWRIYAGVWTIYLLVLGLALQLETLRLGKFNLQAAMDMVLSAPSAPILALLWPLSGWLERRNLSNTAVFLCYVAGALVYAVLYYFPLWTVFGSDKPLAWHIWPMLYCIMTYGIIAASFHMVRMSEAAQRQAAAIQQARSLLVASELSALRNKLNPHFLFNTLHSIIALTRKNPAAAETALFQFSDMLRYVLDTEKNGSDRVTLDDELRFTRDYLELESLRLGQRLKIEWELDDAAAGHPLPALSLQPLVENSIKHAFNPHSRPGTLSIRTRIEDEGRMLALTVGDDGPGADLAAVRGSNGLGIRTVERRLQLEYGPQGGLAIETAPGAGFVVTMSIPLAPN
jgi:sensor histidine kinase YesM